MNSRILLLTIPALACLAFGCDRTPKQGDADAAGSTPAVALADTNEDPVRDPAAEEEGRSLHVDNFLPGYVRHDTLDLSGSQARLFITTERFDSAKHRLERCTESFEDGSTYSYLCRIDGKEYFGSDGDAPVTTLLSLAIDIDGRRHQLDVSQMFNPWSASIAPRPWDFELTVDSTDGSWHLAGSFSDGAGTYDAAWKIDRNGARRRYLKQAEH